MVLCFARCSSPCLFSRQAFQLMCSSDEHDNQVSQGSAYDDATENLVLACSRWEGGHLWLEDADGDVVLEDGLKGRTISVQPSGTFNGHVLHRAMPWTGCRTVLVDFHIRDMWRLGDDEVAQLQRLGFMLRSFM